MTYLKQWIGLVLGLIIFFNSCSTPTKVEQIQYNTAYDAFLSGFTHGEISKKATIKVQFQDELTKDIAETIYPNPFSFEPALEGEAVWLDKQTLEFIPKYDLVSGQIYTATLELQKLVPNITEELKNFDFQFRTKDQFVQVNPLASTVFYTQDQKMMNIGGELTLHDDEDISKVKKLLTIYDGDQKLDIDWTHQTGTKHSFSVQSVLQKAKAYYLTWKWDGKEVQSKTVGNYTLEIPSEDDFKINKIYNYNTTEKSITVEFSDLLASDTDLEGLITLDGKNLKYTIDGNKVKLYIEGNLIGQKVLRISANIKSKTGKTLGKAVSKTILFVNAKPALKWVGKGNIIPQSKKMPIIFQSVNINAVDVRVIKVKEKNIKQFFQVNQIANNKELKRVGTVVLEKKIALDNNKDLDLTDWTTHSLDLAQLISPEPGAIYEIALGFRQSYSLYPCESLDADEANREELDMLKLPKNWDSPSYSYSYWDYYEEDYDYNDLKNPCSRYYYRSNLVIKRNILASDLGIIAKQGANGSLFVVSNLQTTAAIKNVALEFYDYHQELITTAKTDKEGMARIEFEKPPFFLIAKYGSQRGYLRLDDGSALSMSRFDVAGNTYHKGLKGFIYGERGVWRPGDELFLNFILEDKDKSLPTNHPVTFILKDSRGSIVIKKTSTQGVHGVYNFTCKTDDDAPTGNYLATVKVGGAKFTKTIKIEAVKPNRLKMNLDFGVKELSVSNKNIKGTLTSLWLHGAPAQNLKAKVELTLRAKKIKFPKYNAFAFNDPARTFQAEDKTIFEGKLDANGVAQIKAAIRTNTQSPGMLNATFRMKIFEPGGDFSIGQTSIPYHPYTAYVGVKMPKGDEARNMLLTDKKHQVEIRTVDKDGNPIDVENLEVKLYKLDWKWWFDQNKGEVANYRGRIHSDEVQKALVSTKNGKATWSFEIKYPSWGRYFVRVSNGKKGHSTGEVFFIDWPGWAGRSTQKSGGATALRFSSDKKKYKVGEEVVLNIPTGFAGRALVTIENGTSILQANWLEAKKGQTQFKFVATKEMSPNAYASVSLMQPHAQSKNDLPMRMYGNIPLYVEDPTTHLEPEIVLADELRPRQEFLLTVRERKGGPMAYTIAIVDEGLLGLTNYKTPSPWATFYQREALGVKTWDMYDDVLGAFGGDIRSLLSIGGGAGDKSKARKKVDRFKPVVLHAGPFYLKKGETATHQFTMPNYVGAVRAMVVAVEEGAYGSAEKEVPVRQPVMVLATLPRVLGVNEKFKLPVTVFAMKKEIKNAKITVETTGLISIEGESTKSLTFDKIGDKMLYFDLKTQKQVGAAHVKVTVTSGSEKAVYETDISIRNANPRETKVLAKALEKGDSWEAKYQPVGLKGSNNALLEVSAVPPLNLGKRLRYLVRYPYGCVEQTTSSVFPQVYLANLMTLSEKTKTKIDKNIKAGIQRLYRFQNTSGALSYWPGRGSSHDWGTNYAGHFMIEAQKAGYQVRPDFMNKWLAYQTKAAKRWNAKSSVSDDLIQAYRLYLLALAGQSEMGSMNRMRLKQINKQSIAARWYLATAYHLAGQKKVAKKMLENTSLQPAKYKNTAKTFGSQFRDQALILQALSAMDRRADGGELVQAISDRLASDRWCSTQETAQALVAMSQFVGKKGTRQSLSFEYKLDGGTWQKVNHKKPFWQLDLAAEKATTIQFKNTSGAILFARMIADGIPLVGNETESNKGLELVVEYVSMAGVKINPKKLNQGLDFKLKVTVKNIGLTNYQNLALHHVFPAGWEIHNARMTGATTGGDKPTYQDIRDDRVYTFFNLKRGQSQTFNILANASYLGHYYLPAISVEAMYNKSIHARKRGQWIDIVKK